MARLPFELSLPISLSVNAVASMSSYGYDANLIIGPFPSSGGVSTAQMTPGGPFLRVADDAAGADRKTTSVASSLG
jgi:hypothetical protein